jgi:trehalose utilization protein
VTIRVTVWNEFRDEREDDEIRSVYPDGMHAVIAAGLSQEADITAGTATLDDPDHGLTQAVLDATDVLIWWGHRAHDEVGDEIVGRVKQRVLAGMGLIVLHSGHYSKIFKSLMGTTCSLKWRDDGETERVWIVNPAHPITRGVPEYFEIEQEEMYGEFFDIPAPDDLLMVSWFKGGEVFRSGCTWSRGNGKVFYFRPGHENFPTYRHPVVMQVIANAVRWAAPSGGPVASLERFGALETLVR